MRIVSVFELTHYLKGTLDSDANIQNILVSGEISNFTNHISGHLYFSMKDDRARLSCVMFRSNAARLRFKPKNGDKVIIKANTSVFESTGQLQCYVTEMKIDGIGDLYLQFEELKKKLHAEGLFDPMHKKPKPLYPMKIAVLVGDKSAALSDIETTFRRRWPIAKVDIYPVLVQGIGSSKDINDKLLMVDEMGYEAIILARGGGSIEDLWSFNNETLARTIYNLKTFIITGVGHEQDYTIVDFVADLRAPTPTASVELITDNINDVLYKISDYKRRLDLSMRRNYALQAERYTNLVNSKVFKDKYYILENKSQYFDYLCSRLYLFNSRLKALDQKLNEYNLRMNHSLNNQINHANTDITNIHNELVNQMNKRLEEAKILLKRNTILLDAYGVDKTLKRGYSLVLKDNHVVKSITNLEINDKIDIKMQDGIINVKVEGK